MGDIFHTKRELKKHMNKTIAENIIGEILEKYTSGNHIVDRDAYDGWKIDPENGEIYNEAVSAYHLEFGRLPNNKLPPIEEIKRWIMIKGIASNDKKAYKMAWKIANSIAKNGTPPRPYIKEIITKYGWVK